MSTVQVPLKESSILETEVLPLIRGDDDENLLCGGCSVLIAEGVTEQSLVAALRAETELLIRCPRCGALNELLVPFFPQSL